MKSFKLLLMTALLMVAGSLNAQENQGEIIDLLPENVTANIGSERKQDKQKNMVIAGSPEKGYKAFFAAVDDEHGEELWVTDGTKEGTHLVKDIVPGTGSGNPMYLGRLNDKVLFSAYTDETDFEPWVSDGTEEGTFMLAELYTFGPSDPKAFTQMNETQAIFGAIDDESAEFDTDRGPQHWLYVTDGTVEGTKRVVEDAESEHQADMRHPGQDNTTLHTAYVRVGRRVFFKADMTDGSTGEELWVTDGTEEGTYEVMDINWERWPEGQWGYEEGYTRNCGLDNLENYKNKKVFFQAWTPRYGSEMWCSDGTKGEPVTGDGQGDDHTYLIVEMDETIGDNGLGNGRGTFGTGWEVYDDRIWFRMWDPVGGYEIGGTNMQKGDKKYFDIWQEEPSNTHNSYSDPGCIFDGVYMYCAAHGFDAAREDNYGGEMWCLDGEKVWMQYDFCPGTGCDWIKEQTVAGGSLYWYNESNSQPDVFGSGIYRLDSKDGIPVVCTHIVPTGDFANTLRNLDGDLIFNLNSNHRVYVYKYTKEGWDGKSDKGYLEPNFDEEGATGIEDVTNNKLGENVNVYTINGMQVRQNVKAEKATEGLEKGIYVVGDKKVVVK